MATSPPVMTPLGTTGWNYDMWSKTFSPATYQRMKFVRSIFEGERPYNLGHYRKDARVTGAVLAQNADGTGLTYVNPIGTPITVTPVGSTVPFQWNEDLESQTDFNIDPRVAQNGESALAELTETNACANIPSLTQSISQADFDGPMLRKAMGRLMGNTNGMYGPGEDPEIFLLLSNTQYPNAAVVSEFNNAQLRGGSETPYVKGIWQMAGGVNLIMTTVVTQDTNGWHNCIYVKEAFLIAWNTRSRIKRQDIELANRVILFNNVGSAVYNDLRAIDLRTTSSAL